MDETLYGRWWTPYRAVIASRFRAQRSYRVSFVVEAGASMLSGVIEFCEVWVLFHTVKSLGGLDFTAMLLLFGLATLTFAIADLLVGHIDTLPDYIRRGTIDAFHLRPQPLLLQLITSDVTLRRLTRVLVAGGILTAALVVNPIHWTPAKVLLLIGGICCGVLIFTGLFITAAALQFFLINGGDLTHSFTYGSAFASQQPTPVFPTGMKLVFGLVIPVAFVSYLPTVALLDRPGAPLLPSWLVWAAPLAAGWVWATALWLWRVGTRHYQGGGG